MSLSDRSAYLIFSDMFDWPAICLNLRGGCNEEITLFTEICIVIFDSTLLFKNSPEIFCIRASPEIVCTYRSLRTVLGKMHLLHLYKGGAFWWHIRPLWLGWTNLKLCNVCEFLYFSVNFLCDPRLCDVISSTGNETARVFSNILLTKASERVPMWEGVCMVPCWSMLVFPFWKKLYYVKQEKYEVTSNKLEMLSFF